MNRLSRLLYLTFSILTFILIVGSLTLVRAELAPEDNPRYRSLPGEFRQTIHEMEENHKSLIDLWVAARDSRLRLRELMLTLGRQERRQAAVEIRSLQRTEERLNSRFRQTMEREIRSYERQFDSLQRQIWQRQESMDPTDMNRFYQQQQEIDDLRQRAIEAEKPIRTMRAMVLALDFDLPSDHEVARISGGRREAPARYNFLKNNAPRLLDGRMELLDCLADLERLQKEKEEAGRDWDARRENQLRSLISQANRVWTSLHRLLEREIRGELREQQSLEQDIARLEDRLEGQSGRMRERLSGQLREARDKLEEVEEVIARYRAATVFPRAYSANLELISTIQ